jgi:malonyl-CoA/methylmalonyl-CoA synthetase
VIPQPGVRLEGDDVVAKLKFQLANFKIPKRCFVVDELPRNTMGKVQKNLLRDRYKDLFSAA